MAQKSWNDSYSVQIPEIDAQHQILFGLIDELFDAMAVGKGKVVLGDVINRLLDYTVKHFGDEERALAQVGYSALSAHKVEHALYTRKVAELKQQYDSNSVGLSVPTMNFLKDWIANHIKIKDKEYAPYLIGKKLALPQ